MDSNTPSHGLPALVARRGRSRSRDRKSPRHVLVGPFQYLARRSRKRRPRRPQGSSCYAIARTKPHRNFCQWQSTHSSDWLALLMLSQIFWFRGFCAYTGLAVGPGGGRGGCSSYSGHSRMQRHHATRQKGSPGDPGWTRAFSEVARGRRGDFQSRLQLRPLLATRPGRPW